MMIIRHSYSTYNYILNIYMYLYIIILYIYRYSLSMYKTNTILIYRIIKEINSEDDVDMIDDKCTKIMIIHVLLYIN